MCKIRDVGRFDPVARLKRANAVDDFLSRIVGRRQNLKRMHESRVFIKSAEIRERSADINSDSVSHGSDCLQGGREVKGGSESSC